MAEIDVLVNGRTYRLACEDGEEDHLLALVDHIDTHARALAKSTRVADTQLMLMAGLMVADDLSQALDRIEEMERAPKPDPANSPAVQAVLDSAARKIEELAGRIRSA